MLKLFSTIMPNSTLKALSSIGFSRVQSICRVEGSAPATFPTAIERSHNDPMISSRWGTAALGLAIASITDVMFRSAFSRRLA